MKVPADRVADGRISLVRQALNNRWLEEQGGARHEGSPDQAPLRAEGPSLIGTALYGAVRRVVWDRGANHSPGPDSSFGFTVAKEMFQIPAFWQRSIARTTF